MLLDSHLVPGPQFLRCEVGMRSLFPVFHRRDGGQRNWMWSPSELTPHKGWAVVLVCYSQPSLCRLFRSREGVEWLFLLGVWLGGVAGGVGSSKRGQRMVRAENHRVGPVGLSPACSVYRRESQGPGKGRLVCPDDRA